jgi:hypothetical protein
MVIMKDPFGFHDDEATGAGVPFEYTAEEQAAIDEAFQGMEKYVVAAENLAEFQQMLTALGLSDYAANCFFRFTEANHLHDFQAAVAAMGKAYAVYSLPIFVYDTAVFCEESGYTENAVRLYEKFLRLQAAYKPTRIANLFLKSRSLGDDVAAASLNALSKTGSLPF